MAERDPEKVEVTIIETDEIEPINVVPDRPRKVYAGMWGPLEIGAIAVGAMTLLAALVAYLFFVIPSNRELALNKSKASTLDVELISARAKYGEITSTEEQVGKVLTSVDDFETRFLPAVTNGQNALYQRLNGLILSYGLVNTTGPEYAKLDPIDQNSNQQSDDERGREKFRSLYPGVYVTTTVEGTYQNLRRFIREIETGNEFIIVSAVELAPSENESKQESDQVAVSQPTSAGMKASDFPPGVNPMVQNAPTTRRQRGKTHGEVVALRIEMAAYFRRPNFAPMAPPEPAQ